MADDSEQSSDLGEPSPLESRIPDAWHRSVAAKLGLPVRRQYALTTVSVPSETLLLIDPEIERGIEIPGIVDRQADILPKIWTLSDGTSLVGGICVNFTKRSPEDLFLRGRPRSLGRVEISSGILAIVDRDAWQTRPPELRGDELRKRLEQDRVEKILIDASTGTTAVLLPTGYGAGKYAAVATLHEGRILDIEVFMLKGNCP